MFMLNKAIFFILIKKLTKTFYADHKLSKKNADFLKQVLLNSSHHMLAKKF